MHIRCTTENRNERKLPEGFQAPFTTRAKASRQISSASSRRLSMRQA